MPESERNSATGVRTRAVHRFNHYTTRIPFGWYCFFLWIIIRSIIIIIIIIFYSFESFSRHFKWTFCFTYYLHLWEFFTPPLADGFSLELSVSKSPQVPGILFSILTDLNTAVGWMVSTCPLLPLLWAPLSILWGLSRDLQSQLVSTSHSCSINWFYFSSKI